MKSVNQAGGSEGRDDIGATQSLEGLGVFLKGRAAARDGATNVFKRSLGPSKRKIKGLNPLTKPGSITINYVATFEVSTISSTVETRYTQGISQEDGWSPHRVIIQQGSHLMAAMAPELWPMMMVLSSQCSSVSMKGSQMLSRAVTKVQGKERVCHLIGTAFI